MSKKVWLVSFCGLSLIVACVVLSLMIASYNRVPGQRLRFETIEKTYGSDNKWKKVLNTQPNILLVTSPEEVKKIQPLLTPKARIGLAEMDFNTHFALLFYPGGVSGRKGFRISRIYRQDNQIVVHARPGSSEGFQLDLAVRPYQLIEVEKSENWAGRFTFQLYFDENAPPVISTTHHFAQAQERGPFSSPLPTPTTP